MTNQQIIAGDLADAISVRAHFVDDSLTRSTLLTAADVLIAKENGKHVTKKFDVLLAFVLENYDRATDMDIRAAIPNSAKKVTRVHKNAFPVAVVGELLTFRKIRVQPRKLKHWKAFSTRYASAVLN